MEARVERSRLAAGESCRSIDRIYDRCLIPFDRREGMTIAEAAERTGRTTRTLRRWCEEHLIGRRVGGGPWIVSVIALEMHLNDDAAALRAYLSGDRHSPAVGEYYSRAGLGMLPAQWK
jgi:hypothetical protein